MTLVLQEPADCYHLLPSTQLDKNCSFQPKTYEFQLHDPKGMSHGYRRWFHLRPGISLLLENYYLQENLVVENASNQPCTYLELGFNIFGYDPSLDFKTGQNFIQLALDTGEGSWKEWQAQERVLKLDIHIEYTLLKSLIFAHLDRLPTKLRDIIDKANDEEVDYWQIGRTTPKMQNILQQVLNCPYQDLTKQLYLEAKVFELLALRLEDLQDSLPLDANTTLKPIQIDSIYQARDILINNFTNPPTLIGLARQVNLNDCTLKKGFQQIFGTTVFGYLHNYRMEQAKELLLDAKLSVNQVAQYVGYASRSAFMTAFCKKFGMSPSVYSQKNSV
ncbi:helix-turn-helix transcriptional regulator [Nostoc sp. UCD121]|uniref:helix-turn-helix transcriptional regulator n=1 Tax=unclassified Nostoc TaxID=2593658 RepID=UPI00162565B8|nr:MULTISPECIES: AraC family transcriptional regulator [unclassified Nostoc]MBC1224513.1 helix-turn-helix transcriptional regulator [Nostoc sp. UCD120]MBC1277555.1 helix-turn-helix transcriptional regulator [Nostoc sp. UCD121]MBC1296763.1 helix-turn-helix transcriptional regulator [Nostoc sp. UCD122]